jgi:hypothetical protein
MQIVKLMKADLWEISQKQGHEVVTARWRNNLKYLRSIDLVMWRGGSEGSECGVSGKARVAGFAAASRQIAGKRSAARPAPTSSGQKRRARF